MSFVDVDSYPYPNYQARPAGQSTDTYPDDHSICLADLHVQGDIVAGDQRQ